MGSATADDARPSMSGETVGGRGTAGSRSSARSRGMPDTPLSWDRYSTRWAGLHGGVDPRLASPLARGWLRLGYRVGRVLAPRGVRAGTVTLTGLLLSVLVPVFAGQPGLWPLAAAVLVVLSAFADTVDGAVAVVMVRVTRLGYVYDSVADRLGEVCWVVALWLVGVPGWLAVVCGATAWLHEYVRARATAAGMSEIGAVTVGERANRVIVMAVGLALAGLARMAGVALAAGTVTIAAAIWVLLGLVGLVQLLVAVQDSFSRRR